MVLAFQSICTSGLCVIGLAIARLVGWEDCIVALRILAADDRMYALALWLCVEMAATAWVTINIIAMTDSFWGVALKSTRVIYWQLQTLFVFYKTSSTPYSIEHPRSSLWSFVVVCGACMAVAAILSDPQKKDKTGRDAKT